MLAAIGSAQASEPPALPPGLAASSSSPSLPPGLGSSQSAPSLPPGLSLPTATRQSGGLESDFEDDSDESGVTGFWDNRIGYRVHATDLHAQRSVSESRLRLEKSFEGNNWSLQTAVDFLYDVHPDAEDSLSLQRGEGSIDVRKFSFKPGVFDDIDIQLGRQVLTWGTGDLVFLNDFFPKDWRYWMGRDIEYSKAPSDAIKLSYYGSLFNVDLVYTPQFDPDRFINGSRLSFYEGAQNRIIGKADVISTDIPDDWFSDDELAYRLYKNIGDMEVALYGYHGFYKSPSAYDATHDRYQFSRLSALGISLRKPVGPGILSLEGAYWKSHDDSNGDNLFIANGETRVLIGYEWEAATNLTVGLQYYAEHMHQYDRYVQGLANPAVKRDEVHRLLTLRLTRLMLNQDLKLSLFVYYTPANDNSYLRPEVDYRIDDEWSVSAGATLFDGKKDHQNWAQFEENSNIFFAVRYRFDN